MIRMKHTKLIKKIKITSQYHTEIIYLLNLIKYTYRIRRNINLNEYIFF